MQGNDQCGDHQWLSTHSIIHLQLGMSPLWPMLGLQAWYPFILIKTLRLTKFTITQCTSSISHNAQVPYPIMHHFVTEMCTPVHISVTNWCIVGYLPNALWEL